MVSDPGFALDKLSNEPKNFQNGQEMKELLDFHLWSSQGEGEARPDFMEVPFVRTHGTHAYP